MRIILLINILICSLWSIGQNPQRLSLKGAQRLAITQNTDIQNARLEMRIAQRKVWESIAIGLPQVSASFSHNKFLELPVTLVHTNVFNPYAPEDEFTEMRFGTKHNSKVEFKATQLLFSGEYIVGLRASSIYKRLSRQQLVKKKEDIIELVSGTYLLILVAQERADNLEKNIQNTSDLLKETRAMFQSGFVESTDVSQLEINLSRLKNALTTAKRQLLLSHNLLKVQLNIPLEQELQLTDQLDKLINNSPSENLEQQHTNTESLVDYKIVDTNVKLQKLNMERELCTFLPQISFFFSYQKNLQRDKFLLFKDEKWYPTKLLGLNINIPLFSSGQRLAKVAQQKIKLDQLKNTRDNIRQQLDLNISEKRYQYLNTKEQMDIELKNKELSENIYKNTKIKYKNGVVSSFELSQAQLQWLSTQDTYYQSVFSFIDAKYKLKKALGILKL